MKGNNCYYTRLLKFTCVIYYLTSSFFCSGQQSQQFRPLTEGESVPNICLGEIVNYTGSLPSKSQKLYINNLKGRLIILDFWSSFCRVCIEQFPKLFELQREFGDKIIILPVGFSTQLQSGVVRGDIKKLIDRWKGSHLELKLPSTHVINKVGDDSDLQKLFPFNSVPTLVWIDPEGKYIGSTGFQAATSANIVGVLKGERPLLRSKRIAVLVNPFERFLIDRDSLSRYNSTFKSAQYNDSLRTTLLRMDSSSEFYHFYAVNNSIADLYISAFANEPYSNYVSLSKKKVYFDNFPYLKDKEVDLYYADLKDENEISQFLKDKYFLFEAFIPKNKISVKEAYQIVRECLQKEFKIRGEMKMVQNVCLCISRGEGWEHKVTQNESEIEFLVDEKYLHYKGNLTSLLELLNSKMKYSDPLFISVDAGLKYVSIKISVMALKNKDLLIQELSKQGLRVEELNVGIEMLQLKKEK